MACDGLPRRGRRPRAGLAVTAAALAAAAGGPGRRPAFAVGRGAAAAPRARPPGWGAPLETPTVHSPPPAAGPPGSLRCGSARGRARHRAVLEATGGGDDAEASGEPGGRGRAAGAASIGAVAGGLGGALGLGGGFLVVPALTSLMGVEPRLAIGTSSFVVLATSCSACCAYVGNGLASLRAAGAIAAAAMLGARAGASLTGKARPGTLKRAFGGWLLLVSAVIGSKALGLMPAGTPVANAGSAAGVGPLLLLGAGTGVVSGLLGVGGGTVLVPALALLFSFPQPEAQGTALLAIMLPSIVSMTTHWGKGNVDRSIVPFAVVGALAGGLAGSCAAAVAPERTLRIVFSVVLALVGAKYVFS